MQTIHLLAVALLPSVSVAQTAETLQRWELAAVGGYATADGDDFQGVNDGFGYGAMARAHVTSQFSLGVGFYYSDHGLQGLSEHFQIKALYGEGRYSFHLPQSAVEAYVGVRGGPLREDITRVNWQANGSVLGIITGLDWRIAPHLGLELQAGESALQFGHVTADDGSVITSTGTNGSSFTIHTGLLFRF
jgi:opacity protein-like surface antigen